MGRVRLGAALIGLLFVAASCVPVGAAFVRDKRLEILAPKSHSTVSEPLTVRWKIHDFTITGEDGSSSENAGYFGVFVDRPPVPPGKSLDYVAHGDRQCLKTPGCPDKRYIADHHAYSTTQTSFTLNALPNLSAYHGHEEHEVTIVLLDGTGHRIGESAFYVDFFFNRKTGLI